MNDGYVISTDKGKLDVSVIHDFINNRSYWGKERTREAVQKTIENSLCFGVYDTGKSLVEFARVVTDFTLFAYLMDVFVLEEHRKRGLGKHLMEYIMGYPNLQDIRLWRLDTNDAHGLYKQQGFQEPAFPERIMEIRVVAIRMPVDVFPDLTAPTVTVTPVLCSLLLPDSKGVRESKENPLVRHLQHAYHKTLTHVFPRPSLVIIALQFIPENILRDCRERVRSERLT